MADAEGAWVRPVPFSPSGSVTSLLLELPRKSPMFEPYVANTPPARGTPPRCGWGGCGAAGVSPNGLKPGIHLRSNALDPGFHDVGARSRGAGVGRCRGVRSAG